MRRLLVVLSLAVAFASGIGFSHLLERDARAQASPLSSTVYIPSDGLVFRTFDGHVAAKLTYGRHGGVFEVFDEREQPSAVMRNGTLAGPAANTPETSAPAGKRDLGI